MPWILKSEPDVYSIDDLENDQITFWEGVRNYQARNFLQEMKKGEKAFFYHSNCKIPGIYGLMEISETASADKSAFDKTSEYFCQKSSLENPRWFGVYCQFIRKYSNPLSLTTIKKLNLDSPLTRKGNRLSVIPISDTDFNLLEHSLLSAKRSSC
jgi:predicted RNA-binding protein with PUA-like domain